MRAIRTPFARLASWLGALVLALSMVALGPALPALAATPDTFDRFDVDYVAVSYTHLDVYKRQQQLSAAQSQLVASCLLYTSRCV